jgi:hypothetical protein
MLQKKPSPAGSRRPTPQYDFAMGQGQFNEACRLFIIGNKNKNPHSNIKILYVIFIKILSG